MNNNVRGIRGSSENQTTVNSGIGTRHSSISTLPNNNIHININLNVKKKSNCYHGNPIAGKKINNFIQISDNKNINKNNGSAFSQQQQKSIKDQTNKMGKSKTNLINNMKNQNLNKKQQNIKRKKSKQKITSKPYTPQKQIKKQSEQKSIQKTKTGKKLNKKKQSKSVQNLKVFKQRNLYLQGTKKTYQKSNSTSKQRSRSKSNKKLIKNRSSSKNIVSFQNSGIKNVFDAQKQKKIIQKQKTTNQQNLKKSKKSLKNSKLNQLEIIKLHQFMQAKKKKSKSQLRKKQKQNQTKVIKIKQQLLKVDKQRRQNANKPFHRLTPQILGLKSKQDQIKLPMFFGDDDQFDESHDYENLKRKANQIISQNSSPLKSYIKTPSKDKDIKEFSSSGKKHKNTNKKQGKQSSYDRLIKNKLTNKQFKEFQNKIITIQATWRGYRCRKFLLQQISKINKISTIKRYQILDKKSFFWNDDQNNSIINLDIDNQGEQQKINRQWRKNGHNQKDQKAVSQNDKNFSSLQNSIQSPNQQNHTNHKKYQTQSGPQQNQTTNKKISSFQIINPNAQIKQQNPLNKSNEFRNTDSNNKDKYLSLQIEQLKKQMQQQNKKFYQLQRENNQLKQNLKYLAGEKQKDSGGGYSNSMNSNHSSGEKNNKELIEVSKHALLNKEKNDQKGIIQNQNDDDIQIYEIKKEDFIVPREQQKSQKNKKAGQKIKNSSQQKFKNLTIQTFTQEQQRQNIKNSKIKSPSYLQSLKRQNQNFQSPSNRSLHNLSVSNLLKLENVFKKKQLSIDMAYEKNYKMYNQMLQSNIVSPRTYNFKKIELEEKYKTQKEEIRSKFKQAEKVFKFINQQIVQEQKMGEDQSPTKTPLKNETKQQIISQVSKQDSKINTQKIQVQQIRSNKQKLHRQIESYENDQPQQNNSNNNFTKYWTDDMQEVHKKVLEISNKIDQALESESYQSQSNKQYSSLNSNQEEYSSQNSHIQTINNYLNRDGSAFREDLIKTEDAEQVQNNQQNLQTPIFEAKQYQINSTAGYNKTQYWKQSQKQHLYQQQCDLSSNNSNVSINSQKSSNRSGIYDIKYPTSNHISPSNKQSKQSKNIFQIKNQNQQPKQNSIQGNYSGLSQNRSSLSQKSSSNSKNKQFRGFDTRLTFIKQYCIALCEFIRSQEELKKYFIENISCSLKYDYLQYLKSYRTTISNQNDTKYNSTLQDYIYPYFKIVNQPIIKPALNQQICTKFEQLYDLTYNINKELKPQIQQIRKFFTQAIIDVFNQSLNFQRPGSIYGQPLPWLVQSKNLKNNQVKHLKQTQNVKKKQSESSDQQNQNQEDQKLDKIFGVAIAKIIQWGSCLCGFIPEPVSFDNQQAQTVNIDQEQTNLVRQTRLAYMLQKSLAQDQQKMIDNTLQQLEVDLELQQFIFNDLLQEALLQMHQLFQ